MQFEKRKYERETQKQRVDEDSVCFEQPRASKYTVQLVLFVD
jgi:hypothetical protein